MFALPLIAFPFLVALALYRLYVLPRRVLAGNLHLSRRRLSALSAATAIAYVVLLIYTLSLVVLTAKTLATAPTDLMAWLSIAPVFAGYPIVYIAAEWVFYYGFQRPAKK